MAQKILLVEDDPCFGSVLKSYLELSDYEVTLCVNGNDGLEAFRKDKFDICLLDVMMPEMDGFTLGKKIREIDGNVPFVYITAKSMKEDMKQGYEIGADDYIVKPFEPKEMTARVKAVLRRTNAPAAAEPAADSLPKECVTYPDLIINQTDYSVTYKNKRVEMPPKELELLYFLASHPNQVFTREQLLDHIWSYDYIGDTRTVDVHIKRLREKFEEHPQWELKTVWGIGYKFEYRE